LEHEVLGKPLDVAFDGFIETLGHNRVQFGEIGIEHYLLPANQLDHPFDALQRNGQLRRPGEFSFGHGKH